LSRKSEQPGNVPVANPPESLRTMTEPTPSRRRRPRLDAGAKARLDAEIARLDAEAAARAMAAAPAPAPDKGARAAPAELPATVRDVWNDIRSFRVDQGTLDANLVITAARTDPAHAAFDVLRTRLIHAMRENGWTRVGITSPRQGCGKSFVAANLAITLSRYDALRVVLMDMDLRRPTLDDVLGVPDAPAMGDFLRGLTPPADFLRRPGQNLLNIGQTLAVGFNGRTEAYAAELFQSPATGAALDRMMRETRADLVLYDMPPALALDDVIAFRPYFDCVLIVAGGGKSTAREMKETVRRIGDDRPVVGVILNQGQGEGADDYIY
jgi:Mrp family chromosome partitioning ATPase